MTDYRAKLLVAAPSLGDPQFRHAVVLVLYGSDEEAFGLVLNRESDKRIAEIWQGLYGQECVAQQHLFVGGPVLGPMIALHTNRTIADAEITTGLYFSTDKDAIDELVANPLQPFRLYIGGAGWGKNQLAEEINQGAWYVLPGKMGDVFEDPTEIWRKSLARAGHGFLANMLHRKNLSDDPMMN